jgi:hypothetical protein
MSRFIPRTGIVITTTAGDLYWQVPSRVVKDAIELLELPLALR